MIKKHRTEEQISFNMKQIKNKDTEIEVILRKALWSKGYRYRKNYKGLPGKPDIVLTKYKIAIFCDSEFFHGKDWDKLQIQLKNGHNSDFWIDKISQNMKRDSDINNELRALGWEVIRFWGKDIKKDLDSCIKAIEDKIFELKLQNIDEYKETLI